jgi:hypothetical protein
MQRLLGGDARDVGIVVFLREMRENQEARPAVETVGISEVFANSVIGEMAGAAQDPLLHDPRVGTDFQHVEVVIGLQNQAIGIAKMNFDELGHVAQVGDDGYFYTIGAKSEADGIGGVMRNGEGVDLDIPDGEALAGVNGFDAAEPLAERIRQGALERVHGGLGDVQGSFPQAQNLRQTAAMIVMLVRDENAVQAVEAGILLDGRETRQSFAFAEAGVDEEASALRLKQGDIARASGRQNGHAQADSLPPERLSARR